MIWSRAHELTACDPVKVQNLESLHDDTFRTQVSVCESRNKIGSRTSSGPTACPDWFNHTITTARPSSTCQAGAPTFHFGTASPAQWLCRPKVKGQSTDITNSQYIEFRCLICGTFIAICKRAQWPTVQTLYFIFHSHSLLESGATLNTHHGERRATHCLAKDC